MILFIFFHRFIAVDNEEDLVLIANDLVEDNTFLAGVVFNNTEEDVSSKDISYTIRIDFDKTPSTFEISPIFWRPGPYSNMATDMKYHQGFILLQQILDDAIMQYQYKVHTGRYVEVICK